MVAAGRGIDERVVGAMNDQGGDVNGGEHGPYVNAAVHTYERHRGPWAGA